MVAVMGLGGSIAAPPAAADRSPWHAIEFVDQDRRYPVVETIHPWQRNRGTLGTGYASGLVGDPQPSAVSAGYSVFAWLPAFISAADPKIPMNTAYAWVKCWGAESFVPGARLDGRQCQIVQPHPTGPVTIEEGRVRAVNDSWKVVPPGETAFKKSITLPVTPDLIGYYLGISYTIESRRGNLLDVTSGTSSPILVMPANLQAASPALIRAAIGGGRFIGRSTTWGAAPTGTTLFEPRLEYYICRSAAAATDTRPDWAAQGGCRLHQGGGVIPLAGLALAGRLPGDAVGSYLIVNNTVRATGINGSFPVRAVQPLFTNRSPAALIRAAGDPAAAAELAAAEAEQAADPVPPADPVPVPAAPADAAPAPAPTSDPVPGPAAPAADAGGATGSPAAAAQAAGVDLATAPLADAAGRGTGASAAIVMELAASTQVKVGRMITMKAVISPKGSTGRVRLAMVRFNAKGKPIATKAIFAPVKQGVAKKRWRIPPSFTPSAFTLVATYLPDEAAGPGVTRTASVTILPR